MADAFDRGIILEDYSDSRRPLKRLRRGRDRKVACKDAGEYVMGMVLTDVPMALLESLLLVHLHVTALRAVKASCRDLRSASRRILCSQLWREHPTLPMPIDIVWLLPSLRNASTGRFELKRGSPPASTGNLFQQAQNAPGPGQYPGWLVLNCGSFEGSLSPLLKATPRHEAERVVYTMGGHRTLKFIPRVFPNLTSLIVEDERRGASGGRQLTNRDLHLGLAKLSATLVHLELYTDDVDHAVGMFAAVSQLVALRHLRLPRIRPGAETAFRLLEQLTQLETLEVSGPNEVYTNEDRLDGIYDCLDLTRSVNLKRLAFDEACFCSGTSEAGHFAPHLMTLVLPASLEEFRCGIMWGGYGDYEGEARGGITAGLHQDLLASHVHVTLASPQCVIQEYESRAEYEWERAVEKASMYWFGVTKWFEWEQKARWRLLLSDVPIWDDVFEYIDLSVGESESVGLHLTKGFRPYADNPARMAACIGSIDADSAAGRDGRLQVGDVLLRINGTDVDLQWAMTLNDSATNKLRFKAGELIIEVVHDGDQPYHLAEHESSIEQQAAGGADTSTQDRGADSVAPGQRLASGRQPEGCTPKDPCKCEHCGKVLKNADGKAQHVRAKHAYA